MKITAVVTFLLLLSYSALHAVEEYELDNEINKTIREIEKARSELTRTREAIDADKKEFRQYRERTDSRIKNIQSRTDSLSVQIQEVGGENDSLKAIFLSLETREKEYHYLRNQLRKVLISLCDSISDPLSQLPPSAASSSLDAVRFLRSELIGKNIDNIEAMQRLFTILGEVDEETMNISMLHGPSPVPRINGMVNRLRIGAVFEAAVGENTSQVALWDTDGGRWIVREDSDLADQIRKAVAIREGKEVPSLINLPLPRIKDATDSATAENAGGVE